MSFVIGIDENGIIYENASKFKTIRENKGKSKILFPDRFVIIDLETTGLEPDFDNIIEVAALKIHDGQIIEQYQSLVKPYGEIDDYITELTGITNEMLSSAPAPEKVLSDVYAFSEGYIFMGHNVNFDINFLYDWTCKLLNKCVSNDFVDTLRIARKLYPGMKHHRLQDLVSALNIPSNGFHRAMNDCHNTYFCYLHMLEDIKHQYGSEAAFVEKFKKSSHSKLNANDLSTDKTDFDISHPLFGKLCVFTGTLEKMQRKDAMQLVLDLGGEVGNSVTAKTNYLILGNNDYCSSIKDGKSNKHKKAEELKLKGKDIEIITENIFYEMLEE